MLDSGDDAGDRAGDAVWLTYAEIAAAKGISARAAVRMTQRRRLRRQPGNDGKVRVLVPRDMLKASHRASHRASQEGLRSDRAGDAHDVLRAAHTAIEALRGENAVLRTAIDAKDGEMAAMRGELATVRGMLDGFRLERDQALADLAAAQTARSEAEADAAELRQSAAARKGRGRWARLRAAWRGAR